MSKYINAEEAYKAITEAYPLLQKGMLKKVIGSIPTADVDEVKHGRWLTTDAYPHKIYCSNCYGTYALDHWGIWIDGSLPRVYCPNCGSRMDLDGDAE